MASPGPLSSFYGTSSGTFDIYSDKRRTPGPGGAPSGNAPVTVSNSDVDKLLTAAWRALPLMPQEIRAQVAALLTKKAMIIIAGVAVVWAGSQFFGVGEVFDVIAAGVTWATVGWDAVKGLKGYYDYYQTAVHAKSDADINKAAKYFADATISTISAVGWGRFAKWMGKGAVRAGAAVGIEDAALQIARWRQFIESITFEVPADRGMLWSSMQSAKPAEAAEQLAKDRGLVTLEMALKKTGFFELYNNEFGPYEKLTDAEKGVTKEIWTMVSKRYVQSLRGKVTGYVHRASHYGKINKAANPKIINPTDPVIVQETAEISKMLLENKQITELLLIDIETGEAFGYRTREVLESLQKLENKPTFLPHIPPNTPDSKFP